MTPQVPPRLVLNFATRPAADVDNTVMTMLSHSNAMGIRRRDLIHSMVAVTLGWAFEAYDFMLFPMLAVPIMGSFGAGKVEFGLMVSLGLLGTMVGGTLTGMLADRLGRKTALALSLIIYGLGTVALALAPSLVVVAPARFVVGFGLGAEWSTGMALISEVAPPDLRGRAVGLVQSGWPLGVLIAIATVRYLYPVLGWRGCFLAAALPVVLVVYIMLRVPESGVWKRRKERGGVPLAELFRRGTVRTTLTALLMNILAMFSYWMFWTWVPTYLYEVRGLSVVRSAEWLVTTQVGAWLGYVTYGYLQDSIGRRPAWTLFTAAEALAILVYLSPIPAGHLLWLGLVLGYFTGYWSGFGALLSEVFPTRIRGTALGFIFNAGRAVNFVSPLAIAVLSETYGWTWALSLASAAALGASALVWAFPETRGKVLD